MRAAAPAPAEPTDVAATDLSLFDAGLWVGAAFPCEAAAALAAQRQVKVVIDLRAEACDDAAALAAHGVDFLHLPTPDMEAVRLDDLSRGAALAQAHRARGGAALIHCQHGIGRSVLLALCVMARAGWPPLAALERAKSVRPVASPSRAQYEGWRAFLIAEGSAPPSFEEFAAIAYRHLRRA